MKHEFTAKVVRRIIGISQDLLAQWIDRGFIPVARPAPGSGYKHLFSLEDIFRLLVFQEIIKMGLKREVAGRIACCENIEYVNEIARLLNKPTPAGAFSYGFFHYSMPVDKINIKVVKSEDEMGSIYEELRGLPLFFVINLSAISKCLEGLREEKDG